MHSTLSCATPPTSRTSALNRTRLAMRGVVSWLSASRRAVPHLQTLNLKYSSIDSLSDALGQLRSLTCLEISFNRIRRIQPALYALILQLDTFDVFLCPLEDPP